MKAYSSEFRRDVLAACDAGGGTRAVALRFGVSESWVRGVKQERRESGKVAPARTRVRVPRWAAQAGAIAEATRERPDRTLGELKAHLGTDLSASTPCRALRALRLTVKKKSRSPPSAAARTWPAAAPSGSPASPGWTPSGWRPWTRPGPGRT